MRQGGFKETEKERKKKANRVSRRFTKDERIRKKNDFIRVYSEGKRYVCPEFSAFYLIKKNYTESENKTFPARLGMSVGRKFGCAVDRNKIKRRIREIFRLNKHNLKKGCDIIIQPNSLCKYEALEKALLNFFVSAGLTEETENKINQI